MRLKVQRTLLATVLIGSFGMGSLTHAQNVPMPPLTSGATAQNPGASIPQVPSYVFSPGDNAIRQAIGDLPPSSLVPAHIPEPQSTAPFKPFTGKDPNVAALRAILAQPENAIDLAKVELQVEHMIDPHVDQASVMKKLDTLAAGIRARYPQGEATDTELKGMTLLMSLRDPGPWNGWQGFRYDFANPFGNKVQDKMLSSFLTTHLGNCVSMPELFVVLGQKLGLPVTLSDAPRHYFAKFQKDDGTWTNVEVTSYGGQTDAHYMQKLDIPKLAMDNKLWLQTLTHKQAAVLMFEPLEQYYKTTNQPDRQLALTDVILKFDPKNVSVMIYRGDAFAQLSDDRYLRYGSPSHIPRLMFADYERLERENQQMFAQAMSMGWQPESAEHRVKYMQSIQQAQLRQGGG